MQRRIVGSRCAINKWPFGRLSHVELDRKIKAGVVPKPFKMTDRVSRDGRSRQRNWWFEDELDAAYAALVARANREA